VYNIVIFRGKTFISSEEYFENLLIIVKLEKKYSVSFLGLGKDFIIFTLLSMFLES